jgi:hypothetical protein
MAMRTYPTDRTATDPNRVKKVTKDLSQTGMSQSWV